MTTLKTPPVLSTPANHIFEGQPAVSASDSSSKLLDEQLYVTYEIERTIDEIRKERYSRVALQFPDTMLPDAPRVFEALSEGLDPTLSPDRRRARPTNSDQDLNGVEELSMTSKKLHAVRFYILADTSYGACCVDEIAAQHINADAVVHYGRACLSPTARIPVIHIFTVQQFQDQSSLIRDFEEFYVDPQAKVILMADVTYQDHLGKITAILQSHGYTNLYMTDIMHDPSSPLPNRTVPDEVKADPAKLKTWQLFHISDPPESLLLTLASRLASIRIYPASTTDGERYRKPFLASTSRALNRRYALLTSVSTASVFGILVNTLSVRDYLHIVEHVKYQIQAAGKKSYTFVVGKVNAAKVANFSEIGAWIVIGCWESSLIDSKDFWKPVLTPFELELALKADSERVWTGEWSSDFQSILQVSQSGDSAEWRNGHKTGGIVDGKEDRELDSEEESAPPDYDLRTGRYVSHARPMRKPYLSASGSKNLPSNFLARRTSGDLAVVGGEASPGAEYLKSKRVWKGLGSDFEIAYEDEGAIIEQGRSGIARGYTHDQEGPRI
ncbi:Diphthamide biosynthesis protein 2 [Imshaugia aleurites]|uniref:2-(3-amino-3-carboxypropyl)histidine synthase subunit 2 n=1 Tax=Imshaugia aleurites TaxID=172621 RepID=A0A8H3I592_9LECA|nr:Diphthamide biosynthesis protein 2 [Imshaugia aleurites]